MASTRGIEELLLLRKLNLDPARFLAIATKDGGWYLWQSEVDGLTDALEYSKIV